MLTSSRIVKPCIGVIKKKKKIIMSTVADTGRPSKGSNYQGPELHRICQHEVKTDFLKMRMNEIQD